MPLAISPHYTLEQFTVPLSIEDRVLIFADRVRGWQLDVAERLETDAHAGFAVLAVVASYFELIAKYQGGYVRADASKRHFKVGARSVLEPHLTQGAEISDALLNVLYEDLRCGMYHGGMTGPRIRIEHRPGIPLISLQDGHIVIDPAQLVLALQDHFSRYVRMLAEPSNAVLRENFRARFDAGVGGKFTP